MRLFHSGNNALFVDCTCYYNLGLSLIFFQLTCLSSYIRLRIFFPNNDVMDLLQFNDDDEANIDENAPPLAMLADGDLAVLSPTPCMSRIQNSVLIPSVVIAVQKWVDYVPPTALDQPQHLNRLQQLTQ